MSREKPKTHRLYFDTNIIYSDDKSVIIKPTLGILINKFENKLLLPTFIPDLVQEELVSNRYRKINRDHKNFVEKFEDHSKLFNIDFNIVADINNLEYKISERFTLDINSIGGKIININYDELDIRDIIRLSVRKELPFDDKKNEKGFKDYIIMKCIVNDIISNGDDAYNVFITSDEVFYRHASVELSKLSHNTLIFKDLKALENHLDQYYEKYLTDKILELLEKAIQLEYYGSILFKEQISMNKFFSDIKHI